jgi:hypothetical protein
MTVLLSRRKWNKGDIKKNTANTNVARYALAWRRFMVFNATFNNSIGGGSRSTRRKPPTYRKSLTNFITYII